MQLFLAFILIPIYLLIFLVFGQAFYLLIRSSEESIIHKMIIGFFFYFALFQLLALPLKIALVPLSVLSTSWVVVVIVVVFMTGFALVSRKDKSYHTKNRRKRIRRVKEKERKVPYFMIAIGVMIAIQFVVIELNKNVGSPWDASYYIGEVSSSIYTNTISQYDAYTGLKLQTLNTSYLLENYQMHSAIISQIFHLHPLLEMRTTMPGVVVILTNLVLLKLAMVLFKNDKLKSTLFLFFTMLIQLFYTSIYASASFYFNRTFEGKAILSATVFPTVLYMFLKMSRQDEAYEDDKANWYAIFIVVCGTFCINMSAMFLLPILLTALWLPYIIIKRDIIVFRNYCITLIPCFMVILYYLAISKGFGIVTIS